jgi:tetratricopeptide (TPR) repeat protein
MPVEAHYQAYLSYSHADRELAQWLHHALETYRIPKKLIGKEMAVGPVPPRLGRIFKDREELAASGSLGAEIDAALAASGAVIVICSRAAAQSRWVNEEIRNFKRHHGAGRVFAVIADGEPFATGMAGREADECFPPALRFVVDVAGNITGEPDEPIAADLRVNGDGKRLATLKLVAGLTGLKLDDLVQREAQRRAQRTTAVAVTASVLAIVMAGLSVLAVRARNEARQQHEQAEGLIEFMLVDLRKKLEPVGRLDILDAIGEKALAHYDVQQGEGLDAVSLGHRSRALHLIGEIRQNRGKLAEALTAFERAADTTAQLLRRAPNDGQRIFDHAQSVFWVGNIARERGQRKDAERAFLQYRDLAQRLVRLDPTKREWQIETAYAADNLGVVMLDDARPKEALSYLEESRAVKIKFVPTQPELANDLAQTYGWMSVAHEQLGAYDQAIEMQRAKQALFKSVPNSEKNLRAQRGLQNAESEIGRMELERGHLAAAEANAIDSVAHAQKMTAMDSANLFWLGEYCLARLRLAEVQLAQGKKAVAHETIIRTRADTARLIASDATKIEWQVSLNGFALALAAQTSETGRAALIEEMLAYAARVNRLVEGGKKLRPGQLQAYAAAEFQLGRLLSENGRYDEAAAHWRAVVDGLAPFEQESNFHLITLLARARLALGDRDAAQNLAHRIESSSYRHPNYADLVNEMAHRKGPVPSSANRSKP